MTNGMFIHKLPEVQAIAARAKQEIAEFIRNRYGDAFVDYTYDVMVRPSLEMKTYKGRDIRHLNTAHGILYGRFMEPEVSIVHEHLTPILDMDPTPELREWTSWGGVYPCRPSSGVIAVVVKDKVQIMDGMYDESTGWSFPEGIDRERCLIYLGGLHL